MKRGKHNLFPFFVPKGDLTAVTLDETGINLTPLNTPPRTIGGFSRYFFDELIKKVAREAPYRSWRSVQGSEIDARFVKRDGSKITLRDKKGKEIVLAALQLAPDSRNIVRKYEEARKAKRPDPEARYVIFLLRTNGHWFVGGK